MVDLRKIGGCANNRMSIPIELHWTAYSNERWPEQGGTLQTGYAPITVRVRYILKLCRDSLVSCNAFNKLKHGLIIIGC